LALRTIAILAPDSSSQKTHRDNYGDILAGLRIDDIAVERVFLFCVSDVTLSEFAALFRARQRLRQAGRVHPAPR
jgi:hypothetical protein